MRWLADHKSTLITLITLIIITVDQASKKLASENFSSFVCNEGIAFGIPLASIAVSFLVLVVLSLLVLKEKSQLSVIGFSFVLAGGTSNFIDRLQYGCVRDFISVFQIPTFNVADSLIGAGVVVLIYNYLKPGKLDEF